MLQMVFRGEGGRILETTVEDMLQQSVLSTLKSSGQDIVSWAFPKKHIIWKDMNLSDLLSRRVSFVSGEEDEHFLQYVRGQSRQQFALVCVDGRFNATLSHLPEGVTVKECRGMSRSLGANAAFLPHEEHGFSALCERYSEKGLEIEMCKDAQFGVYYYFSSTQGQISTQHLLFCVAKGVTARVEERYHWRGKHTLIELRETKLAPHATLKRVMVEEGASYAHVIRQCYAHLMTSCVLEESSAVLEALLNHQIRCIDLDGMRAEYRFRGLALASGEDQHRQQVHVRHLKRNAKSHQYHRSVIADKANVSHHGMIYVEKKADKTHSEQKNHHLLLDREAKAFSRPELEIYADDVVCEHGSTVGVLSHDQLYYLMSRGLPKDAARQLLIKSFAADVLADLPKSISLLAKEKVESRFLAS